MCLVATVIKIDIYVTGQVFSLIFHILLPMQPEELGTAGTKLPGPQLAAIQINHCKSVIFMGGGNINIKGQGHPPGGRHRKKRRHRKEVVITNKAFNAFISGVPGCRQPFRMSQPAPSQSFEKPDCNPEVPVIYNLNCKTFIFVVEGCIYRQWQDCPKAQRSKRRKRRRQRSQGQNATFNSCKASSSHVEAWWQGTSQSEATMWQEEEITEFPPAAGQFSPPHVVINSCESVNFAADENINIESKIRQSKRKKKQRS